MPRTPRLAHLNEYIKRYLNFTYITTYILVKYVNRAPAMMFDIIDLSAKCAAGNYNLRENVDLIKILIDRLFTVNNTHQCLTTFLNRHPHEFHIVYNQARRTARNYKKLLMSKTNRAVRERLAATAEQIIALRKWNLDENNDYLEGIIALDKDVKDLIFTTQSDVITGAHIASLNATNPQHTHFAISAIAC